MKTVNIRSLLLMLLLALGMFTLNGCGEEEEEANITIYGYEAGKSEYVLENEYLKFVLNPETTQFSLTEKKTGNVWYSNPQDLSGETIANTATKARLQSTLQIQYGTQNGVKMDFDNYAYSVTNGLYEIEELENGLKIKYSIGNIERTYLIPTAVPESRMMEFYNLMDSKTQKRLNECYRKYDINKLRADDDKDELIKNYPDLETECVYVMREGLQEYLKAQLEEYFAAVGYTQEDYEKDAARYDVTRVIEKPIFDVSVVYELDGADFVVKVPLDEVAYRTEYPITVIKPLPFFGAGGQEDEGFLLVPDGNGGIIRFNNGKSTQGNFTSNVYGWDYGTMRDAVINETKSFYPVFGVCNNGSSFLCIMEEGSAWATIEADVSGRFHTFNYANAAYNIIHGASMDVSEKSDKSVIVYEKQVPEGELLNRYRFVNSDSYTDMAVTYREYLTARYPELRKNDDKEAPVVVELVGAIEKTANRLGFPVTVSKALTSYKDAADILSELKAAGLSNLRMKYIGWFNDGLKHDVPTSVKLISELGGKSRFKKLTALAEELGVELYLEAYVEFVYNNTLFDGFRANRDSAKYVTKELAELWNYSTVYYASMDSDDDTLRNLVKSSYTMKLIDSLVKNAGKYGVKNLSFADLGNLLGSDYNPKKVVTREETMKQQQAKLAELSANGNKTMIYGGNAYAVPYVDTVVGMDLAGKARGIIDEQVPFYTIALHGLVNYTGKAMNLAEDAETAWLKTIETGAGLYYTFIKEPTSELQRTQYTYLYGTQYELWKDRAVASYKEYNEALGGVFNQFITGHRTVASGVTETVYEDGTRVYVNYNYTDYSDGGLQVGARSYTVKKGGE
ncbi:MAG: hypothetical protein K2N94_16330 [Lachnospiraceae bacterium]|nr:hypothetical protein [Lachnospiraceae bacterium]